MEIGGPIAVVSVEAQVDAVRHRAALRRPQRDVRVQLEEECRPTP
jgi:hypothetical protein